jgi:hypothetical protein
MDSPRTPRTVEVKNDMFQPLCKYIVDIPEEGLYLAEIGLDIEKLQSLLIVFDLETGQQVEKDPDILKYALLPGLSGLAHEDAYQMDLFIDLQGNFLSVWQDEEGKKTIDYNWPPLPVKAHPAVKKGRWLVKGTEQDLADVTWFIGTSGYNLVYPRKENAPPDKLEMQLYNKADGTWHEIMVPGEYPTGLTQLKPFGNWIAGTPVGKQIEGFPKTLVDKVRKNKREQDNQYGNLLIMNPKEEIFLYSIETGKEYTIKTDSEESEVLLIEDDTVFYRVKDAVYKASLEDNFKNPELIIRNPELINVYWAFKGPSYR